MSDGADARPPRNDPGWPRPRLRDVLAAMIPGMLNRQAGDDTVPVITALRRVFLGFVVTPLVFLVLLALVVPVSATGFDDPRAWALLVLGTLTSVGGPTAARKRRIVCAAPASMSRQVGAAMFFGVATGQSAALLGFVAAFVVGAVWPYVVALVPAAIGLARTAPTAARVRQIDSQLTAVGCELSASRVLFALPGDPDSPVDRPVL